ncbi:SLAM family member 5-like isoform X2 [Triplophysa dalaica]|uniref:SLAM family member 5-like isoform X2 n=1 Tax=Triplophysa dalaica TaxID=1582913 RepID=UPI0024DFA4F8|nr:SLAM family member 5-like isoform X2 [Triplophysa dalaica]
MFFGIFICLCSWSLEGVCGSEFVSVSVMEGDSVLLSVNITEAQRRDGIMWTFGSIPIAKLKPDNKYIYYNGTDGMFRDRLKLNETGSLIITDIRIKHSGLYYITTTSEEKPFKIINITVYTRLPVPVITNSSSLDGSSSSYCSVLCSVMDVSHVSLSWYKGKSLLSSISVSEHSNINISLHLECLDDSYTCVINNPITNQTQHLNTDVCHPCAVRKTNQDAETDQAGEQEITYADPTFSRRSGKQMSAVETDVVYAGVMRR